MNKYITILIAFVAMLFAVDAAAYTPPPAPAKGWYVVDQTGRLTPSQISNLNHKIDRISKATKNEFGILFLQDMGGDNIEDVANSTYKAWGIGKRGLDNGALIVVALKERKSRIETGKGSEGEIPDLRANDILKNNLNPHLKTGDFYGGFDQTIDAVSSFLESRRNQKADPPPAPVATNPATTAAPVTTTTTHATPANSGGCSIGSAVGGSFGWLFILGVIGVVGALLVRSHLRRKREEEEAQARALAEAQRRRQERADRLAREARLEAARKLNIKTPVVPVPFVDRQVSIPPPPVKTPSVRPAVPRPAPRPVIPTSHVKPHVSPTTVATTAAVVAGAGIAGLGAAAALAEAEEREARARRARREREEREAEERRAEERRAEERRARAEREEEERRQREREESERQSSYTSISSYSSDDSSSSSDSGSSGFDWGGGSSGGDSGGGFGGGDSGGGGSSSDW